MSERWVTIDKAATETGLPSTFLHEHTGDGTWAEGKVWKWTLGRKMIDLQALYSWIDSQPSRPSRRGQRPCREELPA